MATEPTKRPDAKAPPSRWKTALTHIEPNKVLVRGYPLDEMMGRVGFGDAIYLLLVGELPTSRR
jgi:citrate synthase